MELQISNTTDSFTDVPTTVDNITYNDNISYYYGNYNNTSNVMYETSDFERILDYYINPIFTVVGIVSNIMTVTVLSRPPLNNFSSSVYLVAYCFTSMLLWILMGIDWIVQVNAWMTLKYQSDSICRIWSFLEKIVQSSPYWFLTGATVDKIIAVWSPQRAQYMCTVFMAKVGVALISVFLTATAVHIMWMYSLISTDHHTMCAADHRDYTIVRIGEITISVLMIHLPLVLIFIFGNMLVLRLCLKHHGRQIPNTSSLDLDLTYSVTVLSLSLFLVTAPAVAFNIALSVHPNNGSHTMFVKLQYITLLGYMLLFFILLARCSDFREAVVALIKNDVLCFSRRNANIELRLMNEYNQVPSTSTSV